MIEKLLRRFVSEDTEYVLSAMEHVGSDPELSPWGKRALDRHYDEMWRSQVLASGPVDRIVLRRARKRLEEIRVKAERVSQARMLASKILIGETFEDGEDEPSIMGAGQFVPVGNGGIGSLTGANQQAGMVGQATSAVSATAVFGGWQ